MPSFHSFAKGPAMKIFLVVLFLLPLITSAQTLSDPAWGFSLTTPRGWKSQSAAEGAILGHDRIAGAIIVMPHNALDMETIAQYFQEGLEEENIQLTLADEPQTVAKNALSGHFAGFYQGQSVKAKVIGVLGAEGGGGAFIIALTTPEQFGSDLTNAADALAKSLRAAKPAEVSSGIESHFIGTWVTSTTNTERRVTLFPDGRFAMNYEASYSGRSNDQQGDQTMAWGQASGKGSQGQWKVRGTREKGTLTLIYNNGETATIPYRVHVERGEVYWGEYWFDDQLYGKQREQGRE
jgi:hypothetical protein